MHQLAGDKLEILDLASHAGNPAVPLAKAFAHAEILATDLAPSTISLLEQHAAVENMSNITAKIADAQDLHELKDSIYTVITCTYGLMFMPESIASWRAVCSCSMGSP